ncbi:MAG: Hsp33 family molecular chaperone HslO, partial [Dokdonella sp.]
FADCTHDGLLRGIARWDGAQPHSPIQIDPQARLAITIENASTDIRYQGLVMAEGTHLSQAFEGYFERSEQLPTRIVLAASSGRCGGLMLQKIAGSGGTASVDADGWNRVGHLLATLTPEELLYLPAEQLLLRLFHEEGVRLQPAQPLAFRCTCSRGRVEDMLRSLGRAESDATLAEQGSIEVTCEFCNRRYVLDEADVEAVFASASASMPPTEPPATRH